GQHLGRQLSARADADEMHVADALDQLLLWQGTRQRVDLLVAGIAQHLQGGGVQAFEQQELDLAFIEGRGGSSAHGTTVGPAKWKKADTLACCSAASKSAGRRHYLRQGIFSRPPPGVNPLIPTSKRWLK